MPGRCPWATTPLLIAYHDAEWGVAEHDEARLFEMLTLEGAQAGLSWEIILRKREGYRAAFKQFDPEAVARFNARTVERLLRDEGIVRNRLKIESTIANAKAIVRLRGEGSLDALLWSFTEGRTIDNRPRTLADVPAQSPQSHAMSRALKQRGFRFVGPTVCYAFMQAVGMVNDHTLDCFCRKAGR
ncbi:MAG: DNA-3-methyladenine glycosylase I [Phycisphaerales bacterium JB039]